MGPRRSLLSSKTILPLSERSVSAHDWGEVCSRFWAETPLPRLGAPGHVEEGHEPEVLGDRVIGIVGHERSELARSEELPHPRDVHHHVLGHLDVPLLDQGIEVGERLLRLGLDHHEALAAALHVRADRVHRLRQQVLLRTTDDQHGALRGDLLLPEQEDALRLVLVLAERRLGGGEATVSALLSRALALALRQADRLLPLAGDLDEGVRDVLLGVVRDLLALLTPLDEEDGPGAPHVVGLGLGGALHGVHELDLEARAERLVVLETVLAAGHVALALEVRDLHVFLETGHRLLRLVGKAVALALGEVPALGVADHEVVDGTQHGEDHQDQHERVRAVLHLATADAAQHVLPAQQEVHDDEGGPADEPGPDPAGEGAAGPLPRGGPHDHEEAQGGEEVDGFLQEVAHGCL